MPKTTDKPMTAKEAAKEVGWCEGGFDAPQPWLHGEYRNWCIQYPGGSWTTTRAETVRRYYELQGRNADAEMAK